MAPKQRKRHAHAFRLFNKLYCHCEWQTAADPRLRFAASLAALAVEHVVVAVVRQTDVVALEQRDALRKVEAGATGEFASNLLAVVATVLVTAARAQAEPLHRGDGVVLNSGSADTAAVSETLAVRIAGRTDETRLWRDRYGEAEGIESIK